MNLLTWDFDGTLTYRAGMWTGTLLAVDQHQPGHCVNREQIRPHLQRGFPWHTPEYTHCALTDADEWWNMLCPIFGGAYTTCGIEPARAQTLATYVRAAYCDADAWRVCPAVGFTLHQRAQQG